MICICNRKVIIHTFYRLHQIQEVNIFKFNLWRFLFFSWFKWLWKLHSVCNLWDKKPAWSSWSLINVFVWEFVFPMHGYSKPCPYGWYYMQCIFVCYRKEIVEEKLRGNNPRWKWWRSRPCKVWNDQVLCTLLASLKENETNWWFGVLQNLELIKK